MANACTGLFDGTLRRRLILFDRTPVRSGNVDGMPAVAFQLVCKDTIFADPKSAHLAAEEETLRPRFASVTFLDFSKTLHPSLVGRWSSAAGASLGLFHLSFRDSTLYRSVVAALSVHDSMLRFCA